MLQQKEEELFGVRNKFSYYKVFNKKCISDRNEITEILMIKPVYFEFLILELSKIFMCEFWYDYVKLIYGQNAKPCYMDTDSFIVQVKTDEDEDLIDEAGEDKKAKGTNKWVIKRKIKFENYKKLFRSNST